MTKHDNPCSECASFIAKEDHTWGIRLDACINIERLGLTETEYRVTNRKGENCKYYDKGRQALITEFE